MFIYIRNAWSLEQVLLNTSSNLILIIQVTSYPFKIIIYTWSYLIMLIISV